MAKTRILVDMDSTIANFDAEFLTRWRRKYPTRIWIPLEERRTYYIADQYPQEFKMDIIKIMTEKGFIRSLPPIEGALDALNEMHRRKDIEVFLCTAPLRAYKNCVSEKYEWVDHYLGIDWIRKIILTSDKTLVQADYLIDDRPTITGVENPPLWQHIMYKQPYNDGTFTWENWQETLNLT